MAKEKENKNKELLKAIQEIEKQYGKGSVMRLGEKTTLKIEAIKTGSIQLDDALGIGGYPKGRIIEIYGPESSGKTTLALHAIAEVQKNGGNVAFIDAEHALDPTYAKQIGIDLDNLILSQPDSGEQALEICETLIKSNAVDIVVVDSVAALVPEAELAGEMGDSHVGLQARLMSQAMRKLSGILNKANCSLIFINQIREKVGIIFGNPEVTPGGKALKFYSSVRLEVRRGEAIRDKDIIIGNTMKIKIVKNKVAPPFKQVSVDLIFGKGICKYGELIDLATNLNIIEKSGSWYSYKGDKLGQGRDKVKSLFKENEILYNEIEKQVLDLLKNK